MARFMGGESGLVAAACGELAPVIGLAADAVVVAVKPGSVTGIALVDGRGAGPQALPGSLGKASHRRGRGR
jgi:hypothetical protein